MAFPVQRDDTVTVYAFRVFDLEMREMQSGTFKATRDAIATMGRAEPLESTAEEVSRESIDALGRYRRVATGWGELR